MNTEIVERLKVDFALSAYAKELKLRISVQQNSNSNNPKFCSSSFIFANVRSYVILYSITRDLNHRNTVPLSLIVMHKAHKNSE